MARPNWRELIRLEASGLRTTAAVVLPLFGGQFSGYPTVGLMIGLGGLYVTIADKEGANARTLLITTLGVAVMALIATLVGSHPTLDVVLMFCLALGGAMLAVFGTVASSVGFALTVAFAIILGLPGGFSVGLERLAEFILGGLWCTLLTLLLWRHTSPQDHPCKPIQISRQKMERAWHALCASFHLHAEIFQHALRVGIAAAIAVALYRFGHLPHGTWMILTVLVILKQDYASTHQRALERMGGSLVGGTAAILLVAAIHNLVILDILLVLLCFLAYSQLPYNYGLFVAFLTPFVVLLINMATPGNVETALVRIGDTLAGGALALLIAYCLRPRDTPQDTTP